jgi:hypothetical protein
MVTLSTSLKKYAVEHPVSGKLDCIGSHEGMHTLVPFPLKVHKIYCFFCYYCVVLIVVVING